MGKTPTSPAGRAAPVNGWSLIELLVVLSIVGAVSSLALPSLRDSIPSLRLSAEARQIVVLFREAQRRAVESGQETAVQVDLADYTLRSNAGGSLTIDPQYEILAVSAASPAQGVNATEVRFFPDGTSTGASLRLSYRQRHVEVVVDWMFGKAVLKNE